MSRTPARKAGWLATMPTGSAIQSRKTHHQIFSRVLVDFEEVRVVHDGVNRVLDVVGLLRIIGDKSIERFVAAIGGIGGGAARRVVRHCWREESSAARESWPGSRIGRCDECATPLVALWVMAPPSSCLVTSSWVTVLMTSWTRDKHVEVIARHENEIR